ncbi:hypothetical protein [Flexibacterium corallicola]|uniref:hypothetical protein n=1 Tax=Flexibacterium corallicola TaxID=3037259 RepID=UPI00286F9ED5|nr:hypothetical protein [Pseudovibrio sp. M1P-2-3]
MVGQVVLGLFFVFLSLLPTWHFANASPTTPCQLPGVNQPVKSGGIKWPLQIQLEEEFLTAVCKLRTIPGDVRLNFYFPTTDASKSWDFNFSRFDFDYKMVHSLVQATIMTNEQKISTNNDRKLARVQNSVIQLASHETRDGVYFALEEHHKKHRQLALWLPVHVRLKPVSLFGADFVLTMRLEPNANHLALSSTGKRPGLRLYGLTKLTQMGGMEMDDCPAAIPYCSKLPKKVIFTAPWVVTGLKFVAHGENLNNVIKTATRSYNAKLAKYHEGGEYLGNRLLTGNHTFMDGHTKLELDASQNGNRHTFSIKFVKGSRYKSPMANIWQKFRVSTPPLSTRSTAPDATGVLF